MIFLGRIKMDDQYTWTLSKIEDINCKRPTKDRFFEIQELLCPETFSIKILQFVKKFKLGVDNGFCSPYLVWCLTSSKMERGIESLMYEVFCKIYSDFS